MSGTLVTSGGRLLLLGDELGKGGEGSVYLVKDQPAQVAKIYHEAPSLPKQAKLAYMASVVDAKLLSYVSWPQDTLHLIKGGPVVGFLMPKFTDRDPVHMVYSPAHRKQERPKASWDFLLCVARNTAAAFEALHEHGHVLGDVNQGNVLVAADSKVVLIDSDSFQVNAHGHLHLCEVGVAHFTPPELQTVASFDKVSRTTNHDNFGLALLIFHLLFGGRHPYSGVPLRRGGSEELEAGIRDFRYAYALDSENRGMKPPPKSIPVSMLPDALVSMFQLAFTEKGALGGRPSAKQWGAALDGLRSQLSKCSTSVLHVFPRHLPGCPWCALANRGVLYFVDLGVTFTPTATGFVLARTWALIAEIKAPPSFIAPNISQMAAALTPEPYPVVAPVTDHSKLGRVAVAILTVCALFIWPKFWFLTGLLAWAGLAIAKPKETSSPNITELLRRQSRMRALQAEYESLLVTANKLPGVSEFTEKKKALGRLFDSYSGLEKEEERGLEKLRVDSRTRQEKVFLDRIYLDRATIVGIGAARKATLRSHGIETAGDITRNAILAVSGFGESRASALLQWRRECESRFVFNAATAVTEADKNGIRYKLGQKRILYSASLEQGPAELQQYHKAAVTHIERYRDSVAAAARQLAQATANARTLP
jgi:DNA-binding helix-hairpin-helix protein with protein kinase domain